MAHDDRLGLITLPSHEQIIPGFRDGRQWILAAAAQRRALAILAAGAGRYQGGALTVGDLPGGTVYPTFVAMLADAAGEIWVHGSDLGTAITFEAAEIANAALWLVPRLMPEVSPPAALGGYGDFAVVAAAAGSPPAHGLLLGTGVVTGEAFASFTGEPLATWPPLPALAASDIANDSDVDGADVAAALEALAGLIGEGGGGGGAVDSVFGRTGAVTAAPGDYTAAQVGADPAGTAAGLLSGHLGAGDPHPQYLLRSDGGAALPLPAVTHGPPATGTLDQYYMDVAGALFLRTATGWRQLTIGQGPTLPGDGSFEQGVRWPGYRYDRLLPDGTAIGLQWRPEATDEGGWVTRTTFAVPLAKMAYAGQVAGATADLWRVPAAVDTSLYTALWIEGFGATADVAGSPSGGNCLALELAANGEVLATLQFSAAGYGVDRHAVVRASAAVAYYLSVNAVELGTTDSVLSDIVPVVECRYVIGGTVDEAPEGGGDGGNGGDGGDGGTGETGGETSGPPAAGGRWCVGSGQATELLPFRVDEAADGGGSDVAWIHHHTSPSIYGKDTWWESEFDAPGVSNRLILPLDITVPATAAIGGLQVIVKRQNLGLGCPTTPTFIRDQAVQLLLDGTPIGAPKTIAADWATSGHEIVIFGGSADTWGASILPEHVNEGRLSLGVIVEGQPDELGMGALANIYNVQARAFYGWTAPLFTKFLEADHVWEDEEGGYGSGGEWFYKGEAASNRKMDAVTTRETAGAASRLFFDGFDFESLPETALVTGLAVELTRSCWISPSDPDQRWVTTESTSGVAGVGLHVAGVTYGHSLPANIAWPSSGLKDSQGRDRWFEGTPVVTPDVDTPGLTPQLWEVVYLGSPNNLGELSATVLKQEDFGFYIDATVHIPPIYSPFQAQMRIYRARMRVFYVLPEEV